MDFDDDFDDDLDDILNSQEDPPKKFSAIDKKEPPATKPSGQMTSPTTPNPLAKSTPQLRPSLFDDVSDPLDDMLMSQPKTKPKTSPNSTTAPRKKSAKSVLDDLLSPSPKLDLDPYTTNKDKAGTKPTSGLPEYRPIASESRPATASNNNSLAAGGHKRTVRFSTETLTEDLGSSNNVSSPQPGPHSDPDSSRPMTAPQSQKFISRFEEAELDKKPTSNIISDRKISASDSDFSLWKHSPSSDKTKVSGDEVRFTNDSFDELDKHKVGSEKLSDPRKKLSEFMQSSQDELLQAPTSRRETTADSFSSSGRRSSLFDEFGDSRPKSVSDRAKISDRMDLDLSINRPRTGYGRSEIKPFDPEPTRLVESMPIDTNHSDSRLRKLHSERDDLQFKIEMLEKRTKDEKEMMEQHYKNRLELSEENWEAKTKRLQTELDLVAAQNRDRMQMLEKERQEMRDELARCQEESDARHRAEISRFRDQHKLELDKVKFDHEELLGRLKRAQMSEEETVRQAAPTTTQLQSVLSQVSSGAQDLAGLRRLLADQWEQQVKERDEELRSKDENLRRLEQRLEKERDENAQERERLQNLVSKLDVQLKEQVRSHDEERWFLRQEQNKLSALQSAIDREREQVLEERDKFRKQNDDSREKMLDEQRQMYEQIFEEKRKLSEERAQLTREMARWSESNQFSSVKKNQEMAEVEGLKAAILEERRDLDRQKEYWLKEKEGYVAMKAQIDMKGQDVGLRTERLSQQELEWQTKEKVLASRETYCQELEARATDAFSRARDLHAAHQTQLTDIQQQLGLLADKERHVAKESLGLEKARKELADKEKSLRCGSCTRPLQHDSRFSLPHNNAQSLSNIYKRSGGDVGGRSRMEAGLSTEVDSVQYAIDCSAMLASQMEEERLMKSIRKEADNDREFLNQERAFLDSLGYGSQISTWKSQLLD